ncbi:hypothetical protein B0T26DRAFT_673047 [Lasiosphaeria miniovina]|uniref:Serine protease n=1 Tax=Lasiosphaeria miniovina TaxID=1954250 RepID=A0AA40B6H5_9PEZI|nr:uncharacterized protein B0T26DRAFT_673047 [Lasiosphaeria miniovina]KAK0728533.1 hypothetical protein B0T26DRAFT_673047 [Lasiosphaeria miniovina]
MSRSPILSRFPLTNDIQPVQALLGKLRMEGFTKPLSQYTSIGLNGRIVRALDGARRQDSSPARKMKLSPEKAYLHLEIRIAGNDDCKSHTVISGVLAHLDRNPPDCGGVYNDHNTPYFLANMNTSGGSSGSPVYNIDAQVVALNAVVEGGPSFDKLRTGNILFNINGQFVDSLLKLDEIFDEIV